MWVITRIGFFNIIEQDDDKAKGVLTVKARSRKDLENFKKLNLLLQDRLTGGIEESNVTDYRFRLKGRKDSVIDALSKIVNSIDYGKTKPAIMKNFPERSGIYFQVWEDLYEIQRLDSAAKTQNPR